MNDLLAFIPEPVPAQWTQFFRVLFFVGLFGLVFSAPLPGVLAAYFFIAAQRGQALLQREPTAERVALVAFARTAVLVSVLVLFALVWASLDQLDAAKDATGPVSPAYAHWLAAACLASLLARVIPMLPRRPR